MTPADVNGQCDVIGHKSKPKHKDEVVVLVVSQWEKSRIHISVYNMSIRVINDQNHHQQRWKIAKWFSVNTKGLGKAHINIHFLY